MSAKKKKGKKKKKKRKGNGELLVTDCSTLALWNKVC